MDRNNAMEIVIVVMHTLVALRKESVDRNNRQFDARGFQFVVALRKESVDRNLSILP